MSKSFIYVRTARPDEIQAYLYGNAKIIGDRYSDLGSTVLLVEVDGQFGSAQNQADRLSSGMHGASVHDNVDRLAARLVEDGLGNVLVPLEHGTMISAAELVELNAEQSDDNR